MTCSRLIAIVCALHSAACVMCADQHSGRVQASAPVAHVSSVGSPPAWVLRSSQAAAQHKKGSGQQHVDWHPACLRQIRVDVDGQRLAAPMVEQPHELGCTVRLIVQAGFKRSSVRKHLVWMCRVKLYKLTLTLREE